MSLDLKGADLGPLNKLLQSLLSEEDQNTPLLQRIGRIDFSTVTDAQMQAFSARVKAIVAEQEASNLERKNISPLENKENSAEAAVDNLFAQNSNQ